MDTNRFVLGTSIHPPDPNTFLFMDASHYGWRAPLEPMRLSFHGRWLKDQSKLHINILEMMAIRLALKKAIKYIHHSCDDLYQQYNSGLYQQTRRNIFSQPMRRGMGDPPLVLEARHRNQSSSYSRQIQYMSRPSFEIGQTSQNRMGFGSISSEFHFPNAQLSQCGFVCDTIQSQTPIVCISSSGQSFFSDRRIVNELELSSCICISTNNSYTLCTSQDTSVSVQNSSYCSSLAPTSVVLRGVTTISIRKIMSTPINPSFTV